MKFIKNKLTAPFEIFNLIYKNSPRYFILFIPQVIFSAVLPWLYVYVPKLIIEALTEGKNYNEIFLIIIFLGGASLILNLSIGYLNKKISYYTEKLLNCAILQEN